ncbi:hypothetical protein [Motiliproteus sp. SC1-56]|uniref:hypothetical protein n=1 Tax=Motiliproteus sp. SC1-56 TaxID=2799565 RepID=UPI001A8DDEA6|nr:hypothetical protein [Motiliproteus sp. SC1-56]
MNQPPLFTRQALYDAVWATPRTRLAARWGLSTAQLTHLCRTQDIPLPKAGHWSQVTHGTAVEPPVLSGNQEARVELPTPTRGRGAKAAPSDPAVPASSTRKPRKPRPMRVEAISEALPLIRRAYRSYASPKCPRHDRHRYLTPAVEGIPVVHVFPATLKRALLLFDQLLRAFNVRKWQLRVGPGDDPRKVTNWAQIGDREVAFVIREHLTPIQIPSSFSFRETERSYQGAGWLKVKIGNRWQAEFREGKRLTLDDQIAEMLRKFEQEVESEIAAEEAERQRIIREDQRYQLRGLVRDAVQQQEACEANLEDLMARHRQAERLRTFSDKARAAFAASGVISQAQTDWLSWIARKIEMLDPLQRPENINLTRPIGVMAHINRQRLKQGERYAFLDDLELDREVEKALQRLLLERGALGSERFTASRSLGSIAGLSRL